MFRKLETHTFWNKHHCDVLIEECFLSLSNSCGHWSCFTRRLSCCVMSSNTGVHLSQASVVRQAPYLQTTLVFFQCAGVCNEFCTHPDNLPKTWFWPSCFVLATHCVCCFVPVQSQCVHLLWIPQCKLRHFSTCWHVCGKKLPDQNMASVTHPRVCRLHRSSFSMRRVMHQIRRTSTLLADSVVTYIYLYLLHTLHLFQYIHQLSCSSGIDSPKRAFFSWTTAVEIGESNKT